MKSQRIVEKSRMFFRNIVNGTGKWALTGFAAGMFLLSAPLAAEETLISFDDFEKYTPGEPSDFGKDWAANAAKSATPLKNRVAVSNVIAFSGKNSLLVENGAEGVHTGIARDVSALAKIKDGTVSMEMCIYFDGMEKDVAFLLRFFPRDKKTGKLLAAPVFSTIRASCTAQFDKRSAKICSVPTKHWCRFSMQIPVAAAAEDGKALAHFRIDVRDGDTWKPGQDVTLEFDPSGNACSLFQFILLPYAKNMKAYVDDVKFSHTAQ